MSPVEVDPDTEGDLRRLRSVAARLYGWDELHPLQAAAMSHVMAGRDTLLVAPTGFGKSAVYQSARCTAVFRRSTAATTSAGKVVQAVRDGRPPRSRRLAGHRAVRDATPSLSVP
jgi:ATP-dependent helicase YprA (DUF1998 family)